MIDGRPSIAPAEGGMQIGGYELVRRIGRGGMAEVWVAKKLGRARQQRYVAIKLMAEGLAGQERFARMFRAEADLAAMLTHANIVQVFDEGEENGRTYLVMEWVDGINLVKLGALLSVCDHDTRTRIAAYIVGQLLHALAYAHSITTYDGQALRVVHRDVTPQNVLISNHGDVKLTDFGVAKFAFDESSGAHVKGKVRYMSPEQLSGQTHEPTLDLYATGAILHELCDGQKFRGDIDQQVMYRDILAGRLPPLSRPIPPELDAVRLGLLEPDPKRRFQTAEQAIECLRLWPGYGEMKLEVARLCGQMTGITRPRTGPGLSMAPASRVQTAAPPGTVGATPPSQQSTAARFTPPYGEALPEAAPTVAFGQGASPVPSEKGETVLLPKGGLPSDVAARSMVDASREATTATSLGHANTARDLPSAYEGEPPRLPWVLLVALLLVAIGIGSTVAWFVLGGVGEVAEPEVVPEPEPEPEPELLPVEPEAKAEPSASELVIGAEEEPADVALSVVPAADPTPKRASASRPRQPASRATVAVHVRLSGMDRADLRIGKRKVEATPHFDGRLPVGRHRVSWRQRPGEPWHTAGSFSFVDGSEYLVRISTTGPRLETM